MAPELSIIIPAFNRADLLQQTLLSVQQQTYANWECIVVNDHSTDNTAEVVTLFAGKDPRFKLLTNQRTKGAQGARNTGILHATSNWIAFLDSDDTWLPHKLQKQVALLTNNPNTDVVSGYMHLVNAQKQLISCWEFKPKGIITSELLKRNVYVDFITPVVRKSKLLEIGLLDEKCVSYQEWETFIRLSLICRFDYVPEPLSVYSVETTNSISRSMEKECRGLIYIFKKHRKLWLMHCTTAEINTHLDFVYERISQTTPKLKLLFILQISMLYPRFVVTILKRILKKG
jgi:glycosyltransferase involved in cell wall biosynthesis